MSTPSSRRTFITTTIRGAVAAGTIAAIPEILSANPVPFSGTEGRLFKTPLTQTPLPYTYTALEPVIDAMTMEIHYSKHAAAYAKNLKEAVEAEVSGTVSTVETLLGKVSTYSAKMRNNAGGHYNHEFFWRCMKPDGSALSAGKFSAAIDSQFGSFANFKTKFSEAAMTRFGSGWAWLYTDGTKKLQIGSTPNQDNPLMDISQIKGFPVLGIDIWEHAYYLKYQNRRAEYVEAWFKLIDWDYVQKRFESLG